MGKLDESLAREEASRAEKEAMEKRMQALEALFQQKARE